MAFGDGTAVKETHAAFDMFEKVLDQATGDVVGDMRENGRVRKEAMGKADRAANELQPWLDQAKSSEDRLNQLSQRIMGGVDG